jgi:hypothetical protein
MCGVEVNLFYERDWLARLKREQQQQSRTLRKKTTTT